MDFQYSKWRDGQGKDKFSMEDLLQLFGYLLLQTNGDVEEALEWMRMLDEENGTFDQAGIGFEEFLERLQEEGYIDRDASDVFTVTAKGNQRIRQDALKHIFHSLKKSSNGGQHETPHLGRGVERQSETRPYEFGDSPLNIDFSQTIGNAIKRSGLDNFNLQEEDFSVYETEYLASCATVLLIDISHSMILYGEDRITPAKQVAMALSELILTKYPRDTLDVVSFGDDADIIKIEDIPFIQVGPYHTNTKAALQLARRILARRKNVNKQIFMITDGKPSAMYIDGRLYKNAWGLDRRIVNKTFEEAAICRRDKIVICTFMVARDPYLVNFVEQLTETNQGRAYYSSLNRLGEFIFVDYIRNRRMRVR